MKSFLSATGFGIAVFAFFGLQPAEAGCQLITATHSARSQAKAVETSQGLALQSAYDLQHSMGWSALRLHHGFQRLRPITTPVEAEAYDRFCPVCGCI
jgi:hypothetical protein